MNAKWLLRSVVAAVAGFALGWLAAIILNAVLPPFRFPEDEDTWRNYAPALAFYAVWLVVAVGSTVWAGHATRREAMG